MPVKRTAKKSAAKPLARDLAKTKKKASASRGSDKSAIAQRIVTAIMNGEFDGELTLFDDALTERSNAMVATPKTTTTKEKKVSAAPKKSPSVASITPKKNETFGVTPKFKALAGAKVKFLRYKTGTEKKKIVVEMLSDLPGNPKGKQVVIPTNALVQYKAPRKSRK